MGRKNKLEGRTRLAGRTMAISAIYSQPNNTKHIPIIYHRLHWQQFHYFNDHFSILGSLDATVLHKFEVLLFECIKRIIQDQIPI